MQHVPKKITHNKISIIATAISLCVIFIFIIDNQQESILIEHNPIDEASIPDTPQGRFKDGTSHANVINPDHAFRSTPKSLGENPFATSLNGTDIDGQLRTDHNGNLIIELATRDFFDYFLNTHGEVGEKVVLKEIEDIVRASLPEHAAESALALLDDYLNYRKAAIAIADRPLEYNVEDPHAYYFDSLSMTFQELKSLRRSFMRPEAVDAFFSLEEAYSEFTLASMQVQLDPNLDEQAKTNLIAYHRSQLPEIVKNTETRVTSDEMQHRHMMTAINSNNSNQELKSQLKNEDYSEERIENITTFRQQQQDFQRKYDAYNTERLAILKSGGSSEDIEALQHRYFENESELSQARVKDLNE